MNVTINGEGRHLDGATTLAALLEELRLEPLRVAVERNGLLVRRREFGSTSLADGDTLEIVTLVGGG
jgi:thiamine biosynthesis protein ThiS